MTAPLLTVEAVSKSFGGLNVIRDLTFKVERGETVGLIGPNGAGKTTFFNVLTGVYRADRGRFTFAGAPLPAGAPHAVAAAAEWGTEPGEALRRIAEQAGRAGRVINSVQALLLFNIGDQELTAGELRSRGHYLGSNVSYNLKKLVELGFLDHQRSRVDRR